MTKKNVANKQGVQLKTLLGFMLKESGDAFIKNKDFVSLNDLCEQKFYTTGLHVCNSI